MGTRRRLKLSCRTSPIATSFPQEAAWLDHYDAKARDVVKQVGHDVRVTSSLTQCSCMALLGWVGLRPRNVLDVGCGNGRLLWLLRQAFPDCKLSGVDFSPQRIRFAAEAVPSAQLTCQDLYGFLAAGAPHVATDGPSCAETLFDLIACFEVFEHLVDPSHAAAMCRKRLSPGGLLLGTVPLQSVAESQHLTAFRDERMVEELLGVNVVAAPIQFTRPPQVAFVYRAPLA